MANEGISITFTKGVIEKLAGIKKPELPVKKALAPQQQQQGPPKPQYSPDVARAIQQDAVLAKALVTSRQLNGLLLKAEAEETRKALAMAEQLGQKFSTPPKEPVCSAEQAACTQCYQQNPQTPLRCASAVDAYTACASRAYAGLA